MRTTNHRKRQDTERNLANETMSEDIKGTVLIVDDDQGITLSMSMMLNRKGYETKTCSSGPDAVHEFRKSWQDIDLVLLDMIMPDMDGSEVYRALRKINPQVKVVLISGYTFTEEAKRVREEGAVGFLIKPVQAKELLYVISETICLKMN